MFLYHLCSCDPVACCRSTIDTHSGFQHCRISLFLYPKLKPTCVYRTLIGMPQYKYLLLVHSSRNVDIVKHENTKLIKLTVLPHCAQACSALLTVQQKNCLIMFWQTTDSICSKTSIEDTLVCGVAITFGCWYISSSGFAGSCNNPALDNQQVRTLKNLKSCRYYINIKHPPVGATAPVR